MKKDKEKKQASDRMDYDVNDTSRTMEPGGMGMEGGATSSQNSTSSSNLGGGITNVSGSQGRGWHGDSKRHAEAGRQSHKNSGKKNKEH